MRLQSMLQSLQSNPKRWLVTGVAGFIGSHLLEFLLKNNQYVVGVDNFSTGYEANLEEIRFIVGDEKWQNFFFMQGDIRDFPMCRAACEGVNYVLHQAALGSVLYSLNDPITTNAVNVNGFLNMLVAAREANVESFTYASSSAVYGDGEANAPNSEECLGCLLSPYAVTKYANELYAHAFARVYGFNSIGLRYFNVFGPRQDSHGAYVAVIPIWITAMIQQKDIYIYGDGTASRDFCYIDNVVQANILAATAENSAKNHVYNIAVQESTNLTRLFDYLKEAIASYGKYYHRSPIHQEHRAGDIKYSLGDIRKARMYLGYNPQYTVQLGIIQAMSWYTSKL